MDCLLRTVNFMLKTNLMLMMCSCINLLCCMKFGLMRMADTMARRICFDNTAKMKILCEHSKTRLMIKWAKLLFYPLLLRILFLRELQSQMMRVWFLLVTVDIQNQRENLGMTVMVLFTFLIPPPCSKHCT